MGFVLAILAAVSLGPPFGTAEASAIDDTDGLVVDMTVTVAGTYEAVLVRPFSSFEELPPTALIDRGGNEWGGLVVLPTAEDWSIAFDAITAEGETTRSQSTTLTEMGVDPVVVSEPPAESTSGGSPDASTLWLVAAGVLGLIALGLLAWWTFSSSGGSSEPAPDDGAGASSAEAGDGAPVAEERDPDGPGEALGT